MLLLAAIVTLASACSDGGGGKKKLNVVEVIGIEPDGTLFRDGSVWVEFSTKIDPETVSRQAFRVRAGATEVEGRIEIADDLRSITWFPVVMPGDRNDYFPQTSPPVNGIGLDAFVSFELQVLGDDPAAMMSRQGVTLDASFVVAFQTTDAFLPEVPPVPPSIDPDVPIGFEPAPIVDGDPTSVVPADWPLIDPSAPLIEVRFDEPLDPATVLAMNTVLLTNVTSLADPPAGVGEPALIEVYATADARGILIDPLVSLGDDPLSSEPYEFEVRIADTVTDLGGNPLGNEIVLHFRTADKPGEPNYRILTETFDNDTQKQEDSSAIWGGGEVVGRAIKTRNVDFVPKFTGRPPGFPPPNVFNLSHPLIEANNPSTPFGTRFQMRYEQTQIMPEPGEEIVAMAWGPKSGFVFGSAYHDLSLRLGLMIPDPSGLLFPFEENYDRSVAGNPATVASGTYWVQNQLEAEWEPWPEFTESFLWEPNTHDLVFEFEIPEGGDTYQLFVNDSTRSFPRNRIFSNGGTDRGANGRENTQYATQFTLSSATSIALSKGYDSQMIAGDYAAFVLVTDPTRTGTTVELLWAGTEPGGEPDPDEFSPDLDLADGSQAVAFRMLLRGNSKSGVVPRVESLHIAVRELFE